MDGLGVVGGWVVFDVRGTCLLPREVYVLVVHGNWNLLNGVVWDGMEYLDECMGISQKIAWMGYGFNLCVVVLILFVHTHPGFCWFTKLT